ncbi:transglycosylase SLT domain-containing protein [Nocardioides euryhalodurans]|uniref:Lytic transglycosylase n=1 Tax=Nocardioides euryhalodurans TaxID=2518370 RepID=A0A4P7GQS9_9ACTN|nr:transglycosylase SLT domain-containing protein [Nocardioides euryhalodurans]QBR94399.1 lytic transglycosylase [Nocardioides euryhalodurans]
MDVTSRIQQIQAQLALLPRGSQVSSAGGARFAGALDQVGAAGATGSTGEIGQQVVAEARKSLGVPYVWGGTDLENGVDCSGLVQSVFAKFGIDLPRVSADQARAGTPVANMSQARPGDLIAWDNSSRNSGADHIAIYIGNGQMIEAPRPGDVVKISQVTTPPDYIRRVIPEGGVSGAGAVSTDGRGVPAGTPYADLFNRAGAAHGVDPSLLAAVAKQESGFNPGALSHAGAQGLMQLMPATARGLGVADPFNPSQAVDGAARLLHDLIGRFGRVDHALAAYNAGPGAVLRYDGIPPYPETQQYVRSVMAMWER